MDELIKAYDDVIDLQLETKRKLNFLNEDPIIKLYKSLENDCIGLEQEKDRLLMTIQTKKYEDCSHIIVYTSTDYDIKKEGFNRNCACIKCGLDTSILSKDYNTLDFVEKIMYNYLKEHGIKGGRFTGIPFDFKLATSIYEELLETNPSITDDDVINVLRSYLVPRVDITKEDNRRLSRVIRK